MTNHVFFNKYDENLDENFSIKVNMSCLLLLTIYRTLKQGCINFYTTDITTATRLIRSTRAVFVL